MQASQTCRHLAAAPAVPPGLKPQRRGDRLPSPPLLSTLCASSPLQHASWPSPSDSATRARGLHEPHQQQRSANRLRPLPPSGTAWAAAGGAAPPPAPPASRRPRRPSSSEPWRPALAPSTPPSPTPTKPLSLTPTSVSQSCSALSASAPTARWHSQESRPHCHTAALPPCACRRAGCGFRHQGTVRARGPHGDGTG